MNRQVARSITKKAVLGRTLADFSPAAFDCSSTPSLYGFSASLHVSISTHRQLELKWMRRSICITKLGTENDDCKGVFRTRPKRAYFAANRRTFPPLSSRKSLPYMSRRQIGHGAFTGSTVVVDSMPASSTHGGNLDGGRTSRRHGAPTRQHEWKVNQLHSSRPFFILTR
jgi:hypothetical protein